MDARRGFGVAIEVGRGCSWPKFCCCCGPCDDGRLKPVITARDQGADGPDYIYGFGEVDATALIDLLRNDTPGSSSWETDLLANFDCRVRNVFVPIGSSELKATLAWDDPAAAAYVTTALVNDLDLFIEGPFGSMHRPWVLDPNDPMAAAATGVNSIDNQEQVVVENPAFGIWKRWVCGTRIVGTPQSYGVVTTVTPRSYVEDSCTELINNGGFATGTEGWSLDGALTSFSKRSAPRALVSRCVRYTDRP